MLQQQSSRAPSFPQSRCKKNKSSAGLHLHAASYNLTGQLSGDITESGGRNEMIWVRKHESNTWFLVSNYAFIWYWLSKLWLWPSLGHKHLRVGQLLWGIGHRNTGYQHFSPWVVCVIKVDEDPVIIQVALHSGSTSPAVLVSRPPASHLFLGAARAEFKALHGEGFHDTSL